MNGLAEFEERRLAELKEVVAARAAAEPRPHRPARRARRARRIRRVRRTVPVAAAAAAVVAGVVTMVFPPGSAAPAYAVTRAAGGVVTVDILEYRDAEGLSRRLRDVGVPAHVYYVPAGKVCRQPYVTAVGAVPPGLYGPPTGVPGRPEGMRLRIDTTRFEPGQHFLFGLKVHRTEDGTLMQGVAQYLVTGEVVTCRFTPAPPPPADLPAGAVPSEVSLVLGR
ncbi:hypothetical protein ACFHW2_09850 [Actinomadura sp. LOL_016]|uniref:hypothetical protein n=1 Tax=unclassified Actinomadura TaxID=2626254 RepID=UPI003A805AED